MAGNIDKILHRGRSGLALILTWALLFGPATFTARAGDSGDDDGDGQKPTKESSDSSKKDPTSSDLFTGNSSFSIPLQVAAGRMKAEPALALHYSSQQANGWVGLGWSLGMGAIERNGNHQAPPKYGAGDNFAIATADVVSELTDIGGGEYRTKHESYYKITKDEPGNRWLAISPLGIQYQFGYTQDARGGKAGLASPSFAETHTWFLNKIIDTNGNEINVEYARDAQNGENTLSQIHYTQGNGSDTGQTVEFVSESRPDVLKEYTKATLRQRSKRLREIRIYSRPGTLYKKYLLEYQNDDLAKFKTRASKLWKVTEIGHDGTTAMPPYVFPMPAAALASPATTPGAPRPPSTASSALSTTGCGPAMSMVTAGSTSSREVSKPAAMDIPLLRARRSI